MDAIGRGLFHGPMFGRQNFLVCDKPNLLRESYFNVGGAYDQPEFIDPNKPLTESNRFLVRDIEIFQVSYS